MYFKNNIRMVCTTNCTNFFINIIIITLDQRSFPKIINILKSFKVKLVQYNY